MKVHHLNCGSLCPHGGRLITGQGSLFARAELVCHCLLLETDQGLVLIETGMGLDDVAEPEARLGRTFRRVSRPRLDPESTAARQIERMGFSRADVRHIVLTHAHLDHAGGISDFPDATVHLYAEEHAALSTPARGFARNVYRRAQWAHGPKWAPHAPSGERFLGFEAVRPIAGLGSEVLLLPLPGHTRGHAAVAVQSARGTLLHAGDAYFHRDQLSERGTAPIGLSAFQRFVDLDARLRERNFERLRELKRAHGDRVSIFCAHDPVELEQERARSREAQARLAAV